jgi:hypothetical protein
MWSLAESPRPAALFATDVRHVGPLHSRILGCDCQLCANPRHFVATRSSLKPVIPASAKFNDYAPDSRTLAIE